MFNKKKVSLEEQKAQREDRFLRGRQIAYLICDYSRVTGVNDSVLDYADLFSRVTGVNDSVLDYADLFSIVLRNDNIQEFDTRGDEILLSMEQFPPTN